MSRLPSFGLFELLILAGGVGLLLALGVIVVAVIANKRRQNRALGTRGRQKGAVLLVVIVLVAFLLPLLAVLLGVLWVIPVRQTREPMAEHQEMAVISVDGTPVAPPETAAPDTVPTAAPAPGQPLDGRPRRDFLDPDNPLSWAIVLPSMAGLALLIGTTGVVLIATNWNKVDPRTAGGSTRKEARWARARNVLLVFFSWFALSAFLVLDLLYAISLSYRFVALYAAFWALVGALLLHDRPLREKLIVGALLVLVLFSVRFVDWTSRKPFLKDFYRIREGMTAAQVDRLMDGYIQEAGGPPGSEVPRLDGTVTFRHTDKGWGDADLGLVTLKDGHVTETRFLPD